MSERSGTQIGYDVVMIAVMVITGIFGSLFFCEWMFPLVGLPLFVFGPTSQYIVGTIIFLAMIVPFGILGTMAILSIVEGVKVLFRK